VKADTVGMAVRPSPSFFPMPQDQQTTQRIVRIFVCDDVAELRHMIRADLEMHPGFEVVGEAGDGLAGVRGIATTRPDVVLLDLSMPGLDGLEVIPMIHVESPGTRIVVFSGFAMDPVGRRALALKASRYVSKTESMEALRSAIVEAAAEPAA
jgi:DNA-binding NarL/FixJ family response regulator